VTSWVTGIVARIVLSYFFGLSREQAKALAPRGLSLLRALVIYFKELKKHSNLTDDEAASLVEPELLQKDWEEVWMERYDNTGG
jgi:hypothetical protein